MFAVEGVVTRAEARAEMEVERTHYGSAGADDGKIDLESRFKFSRCTRIGRESRAYIRARALPMATHVSSSERTCHE